MSGGLRHDDDSEKFLIFPRPTVRDSRLSFRARGLLAYLADLPDGWDVNATFLVKQGLEGREAIYASLRELRAAGYYRVEKRRAPGGKWVTGTAVSKTARASWAAEYAEQVAALKAKREEPVPVYDPPAGTQSDDPTTSADLRVPVGREAEDREADSRDPVVPKEDGSRRTVTEEEIGGVPHVSSDAGEQPPLHTPDGRNRTCPKHRLTPALGPCPPCGDWRRAVDAAEAQQRTETAERAAAARRADREARDLADRERDSCGLCDRAGLLPSGLACLHDPAQNPNPDAGGFYEFQQLRAKGIKRAEDGRDPETGRRRAKAARADRAG